jgi:hypothetical protein
MSESLKSKQLHMLGRLRKKWLQQDQELKKLNHKIMNLKMITTRPKAWDINEQEDHELENEISRGPRTSKNNKQED